MSRLSRKQSQGRNSLSESEFASDSANLSLTVTSNSRRRQSMADKRASLVNAISANQRPSMRADDSNLTESGTVLPFNFNLIGLEP